MRGKNVAEERCKRKRTCLMQFKRKYRNVVKRQLKNKCRHKQNTCFIDLLCQLTQEEKKNLQNRHTHKMGVTFTLMPSSVVIMLIRATSVHMDFVFFRFCKPHPCCELRCISKSKSKPPNQLFANLFVQV
jgi:hypothetical protein